MGPTGDSGGDSGLWIVVYGEGAWLGGFPKGEDPKGLDGGTEHHGNPGQCHYFSFRPGFGVPGRTGICAILPGLAPGHGGFVGGGLADLLPIECVHGLPVSGIAF